MLVIAKPHKKGSEQLTIYKPVGFTSKNLFYSHQLFLHVSLLEWTSYLLKKAAIQVGNEAMLTFTCNLILHMYILACFNVVYLSELQIPILWFNLRAPSPHTATAWMKKIRYAQVIDF